jgi:HPr kinase/phosphorylase
MEPSPILWNCLHPSRITVADFVREGQASLALAWESDPALAEGRPIRETAINRPGLALAGHTAYFAGKRIQVLGLAETTFLKNLPSDEARHRALSILSRVPAIVFTRNRSIPRYVRRLAALHRVPLLRTSLVTGPFINAATVLLQNLAAPRLRVAGTMVEINGVGVLLEGEPGIGKSEIALALIKRGHSLIADDTTILTRDSTGTIVASALPITREHMEIRGLGLIHVPRLFGVASMRPSMRLDLILRMIRPTSARDDIDRTGLDIASRRVLDIDVPLIVVPVAAGRDLTNVVEVAALNQRLKSMGHDAARELNEHLKAVLGKPTP